MKTFVLFMTLCCTTVAGYCQADQTAHHSLLGNSKMFSNAEFSNMIIDVGYLNGDVLGHRLNGVNFNTLVVFNNWFATGFSMDNLATNTITFSDKNAAINPQFNFYTFNWRNEIIIGANRKIGFSIPVDVGMGYADYLDDYYTSNYSQRIIADDHFFSASAGLSMNINLFSHLGISLGGRYRVASGVSKVGTDTDYSNYILNASLRFRIFKSDLEDTPKSKKHNS